MGFHGKRSKGFWCGEAKYWKRLPGEPLAPETSSDLTTIFR
jgi:hypothetical protein